MSADEASKLVQTVSTFCSVFSFRVHCGKVWKLLEFPLKNFGYHYLQQRYLIIIGGKRKGFEDYPVSMKKLKIESYLSTILCFDQINVLVLAVSHATSACW